jgi:hypothetical protein
MDAPFKNASGPHLVVNGLSAPAQALRELLDGQILFGHCSAAPVLIIPIFSRRLRRTLRKVANFYIYGHLEHLRECRILTNPHFGHLRRR